MVPDRGTVVCLNAGQTEFSYFQSASKSDCTACQFDHFLKEERPACDNKTHTKKNKDLKVVRKLERHLAYMHNELNTFRDSMSERTDFSKLISL